MSVRCHRKQRTFGALPPGIFPITVMRHIFPTRHSGNVPDVENRLMSRSFHATFLLDGCKSMELRLCCDLQCLDKRLVFVQPNIYKTPASTILDAPSSVRSETSPR